jgi:hypothetical protein
MMTSPTRLLLCLSLAAPLAAVTPAVAAKITVPVQTAFNVALGCQIVQAKVLAVTNTTNATIPAGTHISYNFQRYPDHAVLSGYVSGGAIAPGQTIKKGLQPAYSCNAWFRRVPPLAQ